MVRHLAAILTLPFMVTIVIPLVIVRSANVGWGAPAPLNLLLAALGLILLGAGLSLVIITVRLFVTVGKGTLAPWDPTQRLVVIGIYRYVRNPMITGVFTILLGEAVLFGAPTLFIWAAIFMIINMIYIPLSEEPGLRERFGADYDDYARNVPRWVPRRTAWIPAT
jgi:protein-S-isoprenylcysteine O-methyltransferase Ste14